MPVPTHKPGCRTLHFRPAHCDNCNQAVTYWACSCGSKVLFDETEGPWVKHGCADPTNVTFVKTYTYGVLSTVCPRCGKSVRNKDLDAHNYYTHGIGDTPQPRLRSGSRSAGGGRVKGPVRGSGSTRAGRPLVACPRCGAQVLQKNLQKHLTKKCPKSRR